MQDPDVGGPPDFKTVACAAGQGTSIFKKLCRPKHHISSSKDDEIIWTIEMHFYPTEFLGVGARPPGIFGVSQLTIDRRSPLYPFRGARQGPDPAKGVELAMEELVQKGLTRSIGVSNFNSQQIERILNVAKIKPVINQVECHPYLSQQELLDFCKSHGIVLTAYSPLGSPDRPWAKPDDPTVLSDPVIKAIGEKYGKSPAQVCIRYQIQRGVVVIPKSVSKNRIEENAKVFDFDLCDQDMQELRNLNKNYRAVTVPWMKSSKYYPF